MARGQPPAYSGRKVVAEVVPARSEGQVIAVNDAGRRLPVGEDVPAVYVSVHALWCRGQRLDDRVPSRSYASGQLGDRGSPRLSSTVRQFALSDSGPTSQDSTPNGQPARAICSRAIAAPTFLCRAGSSPVSPSAPA